jgi:hypothetical protein
MPHHTCVFSASVTNGTEGDVTAVTDQILPVQNNHFLPQQDFPILYAAACGLNLSRARLVTPTFRAMTTPFIRPISNTAALQYPQRFVNLSQESLIARRLEELQVNAVHSDAAPQRVTAVLGLQTGIQAAPLGPNYTLRGTSSTAATANAWSDVSVTWQDTLPQGVYAVVGGEVFSATGICWRLILENQYFRPGGLSVNALTNGADPLFRTGGLGEWGRFNNNAYPNVQVFASAADATHEFYIDLVKVG